jgi:APA family basic amino acid/polyamine antiporter
MLAYTGVETVSNLAEEVRDPMRSVPNAYKLVAAAVFAIYFTLPFVALSALPVERIGGEWTTLLALPPEEGGYANDPILGVVENLGLQGAMLDAAQIYVGVLAATILVVATNAGVIGASRITYSMATYRQLPETFRKLHPRFKTPWLALVLFAGIAPILILLPGDVTFVGTLYSFGATFSFTVAHASIVRLRLRPATEEERIGRARPNLRVGGVDWPVFAIVGGIATAISFVVILLQNEATRWTGTAWIVLGLLGYLAYRRFVLHAPARETVRAPVAYGPALALEYRRLLVPVLPGRASDEAIDLAASLAAERGARITAVSVVEVPLDRPLDAELREEEAVANRELDEARAVGDAYGVVVLPRLLRARSAGAAIVAEAERLGSEIIVVGAPRKDFGRRQRAVFGRTVDHVLKHAPCRVLVTATTLEAA